MIGSAYRIDESVNVYALLGFAYSKPQPLCGL